MATGNKGGRQLPKFGEWDSNNPSSAEGFTVIFNRARDDKKTKKTAVAGPNSLVSTPATNPQPHHQNHKKPPHHHHNKPHHHNNPQTPTSKQKKWLCFR